MKILITKKQLSVLTEGLADDETFKKMIKRFEGTVIDSSNNHYTFDDEDTKTPKTFVDSSNKKKGGTLTIGWGHTGPQAKVGNKISNPKAEELLKQDITAEENKTKGKFPKYDTYPLYLRRALTNAIYRGEAGPDWIKAANAGNWSSAATKYLEGWDIDFSKADDPTMVGSVAHRMVTNQRAMKKYAKELKTGKVTTNTTTKKPTTTSIIGKTIYPKKTKDSDYANIRSSIEVNTGFINNQIGTVKYPSPIGVVQSTSKDDTGKTWYYVKLSDGISWWHDYGYVRSDVVTI
jgi:GH24 family phage-related lysozyme (muramidase)